MLFMFKAATWAAVVGFTLGGSAAQYFYTTAESARSALPWLSLENVQAGTFDELGKITELKRQLQGIDQALRQWQASRRGHGQADSPKLYADLQRDVQALKKHLDALASQPEEAWHDHMDEIDRTYRSIVDHFYAFASQWPAH